MTRPLLLSSLLLFAMAPLYGQTEAGRTPAAIEQAFNRLYNFDFAGVHAILDEQQRSDPSYALTYSVRAAALLFHELDRMRILATQFFTDDEKLTDKRLKADPQARERLFAATGEARRRAAARLATHPGDRDAMSAMCMATGIETDYTSLVEHRYFRSFSLSKQAQGYARQLLALNPPEYDAYLTLGSVEYVVGSMNFFFRLFVRFDQIKGDKRLGAEYLKKVIAYGRHYGPFAKILLSVIYLRDKKPTLALPLLVELTRDYPENPLLRNELARVRRLAEHPQSGS